MSKPVKGAVVVNIGYYINIRSGDI